MHERNPYALRPPNYDALAASEPYLAPHVQRHPNGSSFIDYQNEEALRALTRALLKRDFGLVLNLPPDRLCPIVPGRIDYILWIEDLLKATYDLDTAAPLLGMDVGTGASAVYPLLATRLVPHLSMVATELDKDSLRSAALNLQANPDASQHIQLFGTELHHPVFARAKGIAHVEFTMCNPPFYESIEEMRQLSDEKHLPPSAVCTGAPVEMIAAGGEVGFVSRMVEESLSISNIHWFTSLLGRHSSLIALVDLLKLKQIDNYAVTEMQQGRTRRWALAWSFRPERLKQSFVDTTNPSLARLLPKPTTLIHGLRPGTSAEALFDRLHDRLREDDLGIAVEGPLTLSLQAKGASWSRAARRKRQRNGTPTEVLEQQQKHHSKQQQQQQLVDLVCRLQILAPAKEGVLQLSWLYGADRQRFESLWSHLLRHINAT